MVECADLIAGRTNRCHGRCERALIALVSTDEGKELINCDCEGSKFCEQSKERIEVCRAAVYTAVSRDSIVSCTTARWICMADPLCNTALDYYHLYCRGLFHGHKCSHRCNNSLSILDRQEKAAKLRSCYCDGSEDFPCQRVKYNTERYCFGRPVPPPPFEDEVWRNSIAVMDGANGGQHTVKYRYSDDSRFSHSTAATAALASTPTAILIISLLSVTLFNR